MGTWNHRATLATIATAVAIILLAGRLLPRGPERPTRPAQAAEIAGAAPPSPFSPPQPTIGAPVRPPVVAHAGATVKDLLALADLPEMRRRFQEEVWQSDEALLAAVIELLAAGSEDMFRRGGIAENLFWPLDGKHYRPIGYATLAKLLDLARGQSDPSRRSFLFLVIGGGLYEVRPPDQGGELQAFLAAADEALRRETDDRNIYSLVLGMGKMASADRTPVVAAMRRIVEDEHRLLQARTTAAMFLGPGAASWDTESLEVLLKPLAASNQETARAFVVTLASLAADWPSSADAKRRALAALDSWVLSHPESVEDTVGSEVCSALAGGIENHSESLREALASPSPVAQGSGLAYIESGQGGQVDPADADAVFSIVHEDGPHWLRKMAIESLGTIGEQHGMTERALDVLGRLGTSDPDADLRQEALSKASFLRGTNPSGRGR